MNCEPSNSRLRDKALAVATLTTLVLHASLTQHWAEEQVTSVAQTIANETDCNLVAVEPYIDDVRTMNDGAQRPIIDVRVVQVGDYDQAIADGYTVVQQGLGQKTTLRSVYGYDDVHGSGLQGQLVSGQTTHATNEQQQPVMDSVYGMPIRSLSGGSTHALYANMAVVGNGTVAHLQQYCGQFDAKPGVGGHVVGVTGPISDEPNVTEVTVELVS